jgi:hypothetical protein
LQEGVRVEWARCVAQARGGGLRCGCCAKVTWGIVPVSVLSPAGQPEVLAQRIGAQQAALIPRVRIYSVRPLLGFLCL